MSVETLDDWNKLLSCCCEMPSCPVPLETCRSQGGDASSSETTYTDAVEAWEAARDVWLTENPGSLPEDYPVPPPEEPEEWTEYDRHGSWLQFSPPLGAPDDDVPALYRRWSPVSEGELINGTFGSYYALDTMAQYNAIPVVDPERDDYYVRESAANLRQGIVTDNAIGGTLTSANYHNRPEPGGDGTGCTSETSESSSGSWTEGSGPGWVESAPASWACTPTTSIHTGPQDTLVHGVPVSALACPGPWGTGTYPSVAIESDWANLTRAAFRNTFTLSDSITKSELVGKAIAELVWDGDGYGSACVASTTTNWPTIGSQTPWGPCASDSPPTDLSNSPRRYIASASVVAVRVQFKVPVSHLGTFFKVVFDVIEEPEGWEEEGGPLRSWYAQDVEREWTGPGTGPQDDPSWNLGAFYEIPPPAFPGQRRIVNRRFWCYPSSPYGYKPQVTGEGVELPDP